MRQQFFGNILLCYVSMCKTTLLSELNYGLESHCSREKTLQTTGKHDCETGVLRKTTTIDDKLKNPVKKLAPMFFESVVRVTWETDF